MSRCIIVVAVLSIIHVLPVIAVVSMHGWARSDPVGFEPLPNLVESFWQDVRPLFAFAAGICVCHVSEMICRGEQDRLTTRLKMYPYVL
mmetsp:Transcript_26067/g.68508  ORF Transcript_26067/g.68508 Transcript_26067/m.68508 type:complete len:89 (-) Transcript_26067:165-431(-)